MCQNHSRMRQNLGKVAVLVLGTGVGVLSISYGVSPFYWYAIALLIACPVFVLGWIFLFPERKGDWPLRLVIVVLLSSMWTAFAISRAREYKWRHTPACMGFVSINDSRTQAKVYVTALTQISIQNVRVEAVGPNNQMLPAVTVPVVYANGYMVDTGLVFPAESGMYAVHVDTPTGSFDTWAQITISPWYYWYETWEREPHRKIIDANGSYLENLE